MNRSFVALIVIAIAVGVFLTYRASQTGTSYVLTPTEVLAATEADAEKLQRIRVAGKVSTAEIDYQVKPEIKLTFSIHDPEQKETTEKVDMSQKELPPIAPPSLPLLPVLYRGLKPDMFAPGRDVIIDGHYDGEQLVATNLLTQCPSKYEPPTPGGQYEEGENKKALNYE